ncbi:hypothetical protein DSO57_1022943 [Entomophthora muscae]|uniref:Uncharacterized protein n=1 Tax=Entomophthora muscae TaxID=34485 RepID=A0ACC2RHQ0_9FUNG|nr:hypothetical protein DSO57_1022943 [Entomophthora muscae]
MCPNKKRNCIFSESAPLKPAQSSPRNLNAFIKQIGAYLPLSDLAYFRLVCRDWNKVFLPIIFNGNIYQLPEILKDAPIVRYSRYIDCLLIQETSDSENKWESLGAIFSNLKHVFSNTFSVEGLESLDRCCGKLKKLKYLNLNYKSNSLPHNSFSGVKNLNTLFLSPGRSSSCLYAFLRKFDCPYLKALYLTEDVFHIDVTEIPNIFPNLNSLHFTRRFFPKDIMASINFNAGFISKMEVCNSDGLIIQLAFNPPQADKIKLISSMNLAKQYHQIREMFIDPSRKAEIVHFLSNIKKVKGRIHCNENNTPDFLSWLTEINHLDLDIASNPEEMFQSLTFKATALKVWFSYDFLKLKGDFFESRFPSLEMVEVSGTSVFLHMKFPSTLKHMICQYSSEAELQFFLTNTVSCRKVTITDFSNFAVHRANGFFKKYPNVTFTSQERNLNRKTYPFCYSIYEQ